jgi:hypothetical protein
MVAMVRGDKGAYMAGESTWLDILTRYVLPPILGGAGGLVTIWASWGIEKQKQRLARRRELVTGWRMNLLPLVEGRDVLWVGDRKATVLASPYYASLRPHLTEEAIRRLEIAVLPIVITKPGSARPGSDWHHHFPLNLFVEEIQRIEKKWRLV